MRASTLFLCSFVSICFSCLDCRLFLYTQWKSFLVISTNYCHTPSLPNKMREWEKGTSILPSIVVVTHHKIIQMYRCVKEWKWLSHERAFFCVRGWQRFVYLNYILAMRNVKEKNNENAIPLTKKIRALDPYLKYAPV